MKMADTLARLSLNCGSDHVRRTQLNESRGTAVIDIPTPAIVAYCLLGCHSVSTPRKCINLGLL